MRQVYSTLLSLGGDPAAATGKARQLALAWAFRNHGGVPARAEEARGDYSPGRSQITWSSLQADGGELSVWTLVWKRPHDEDGDICWHAEVILGRDGPTAWVAVRVGLLPTTHRVRPIDVKFQPPRIVADIADLMEAQVDGRQVRGRAAGLWARDVDGLVEYLEDPGRVLPVVVATAAPDGPPVIDVHRAAAKLLGLAHVVTLEDPSAAFRLTELVGKERSVYNGAVRVYYPGFSVSGDPFRHPLWLAARIAAHQALGHTFDGLLLRRLAPLAAFRTPVPALESVILERQAELRRADFEELRTKVETGQLAAKDLEDQLLAAWEEKDELARQLKELRAELSAVQENFIQVAAAAGEELEPVDVEPEREPPKTVQEAAERARDHAQYLKFQPEALESAERCQYGQPDKILEALEALNDVAGRYQRKDSMPQGVEGALREFGLDYAADVGETTKGKYKHQYEQTYGGQKYTLGPHIKLGKGSPNTCARIYFFRDEDARIFVVGHIGHHLSDSTSG